MDRGDGDLQLELARVRWLASELAAADSGPAAELGGALADVVVHIADRVDALWQLIAAVVSAADPAAAGTAPPAEFLQALASARGSGHAGLRLSLAGRDWVAAVNQEQRPADPVRAWAALERLAQSAGLDHDRDEHRDPGQGDT
jgi:hypothetical protein